METITLKINLRSKAGRAFKEMLEAVYSKQPGIEIVQKELNAQTKRVIKDARKGKDVYKVKNSKQLFKELGI